MEKNEENGGEKTKQKRQKTVLNLGNFNCTAAVAATEKTTVWFHGSQC